jgi:hypothetical protein
LDKETGYWRSDQATTVDDEFKMENEEYGSDWKRMETRNTRGQLLVIKRGFLLAIGGQTCSDDE